MLSSNSFDTMDDLTCSQVNSFLYRLGIQLLLPSLKIFLLLLNIPSIRNVMVLKCSCKNPGLPKCDHVKPYSTLHCHMDVGPG